MPFIMGRGEWVVVIRKGDVHSENRILHVEIDGKEADDIGEKIG